MGIESVFRSVAGADWQGGAGGGLSASEFAAFLKDKAGADGQFGKSEFTKTAESLGLAGDESKSILDVFGKDGQISVDKFRDLLEKSAGSDKAFNLDELKGGLDRLVGRAEDRLADLKDPAADFGKDAGADKAIGKEEFKALAERAGVDETTADKAFDNIAGDDGEISAREFKDAFGSTKIREEKLANGIERAAKGDQGNEPSFAQFGRDAGADAKIDENEFQALAEEAGISEEDAEEAFARLAGADGELTRGEFAAEDGFGSGKVSEEDFRSRIEELAGSDETSGSGESSSASESDDEPSTSGSSSGSDDWSVQNADGQSTIKLGDKYTITAKEADASWLVKNEETGQETRIHGDPHVDLNNDGSTDFDFKDDMTLQLDDGTKITVGTADAGNGTTFSSELTITNGDNAIQVSGLAPGEQDGKLTVSQSMNGEEVDDRVDDGGLTVDEAGSGWTEAGTGDVVDQNLINRVEAAA
jgi:hypothetical protein